MKECPRDIKDIRAGDVFTLEHEYKRRSFLAWLFKTPKKPKLFICQENAIGFGGLMKFEEVKV